MTVICGNSEVIGAGTWNSASERTGEGCWTWQKWRLEFVSPFRKCLSVNPKYSMWISITMMMQAVDTHRCVCERRNGGCLWKHVLQSRFGDFWMQIWIFGVGLTPRQSFCPWSLLVITKTCLSETRCLLILPERSGFLGKGEPAFW